MPPSQGRRESLSSFWQCSPQAHCGLAADTASITTWRYTAEDEGEWERLFDIDPARDGCAELDRPVSRKAESEKKGRAALQRHKHFWVSQHSTPSMTPRRCVFCDMSFSSSSYDMHRMTCHKRDAALISATQVFRAPKEDKRSSDYSQATQVLRAPKEDERSSDYSQATQVFREPKEDKRSSDYSQATQVFRAPKEDERSSDYSQATQVSRPPKEDEPSSDYSQATQVSRAPKEDKPSSDCSQATQVFRAPNEDKPSSDCSQATQISRTPKEDERSSEYSQATPCDEETLLSRGTTDETLDPSINEGGEPTPPQDKSASISSRDTPSEALDEANSPEYDDALPAAMYQKVRRLADQAAAAQEGISVDLVEAALDAHRRVDLATTEIDACADRHKQLAAELHNATMAYRRSSVKADAARINSGFGFKVVDDDADFRKAVSLSVTVRNKAKRRVDAQTEELARASSRLARARAHLDGLITGMAPADRDIFQSKLQLDLVSSSTTSTDARTSATGRTSRLAACAPYRQQKVRLHDMM